MVSAGSLGWVIFRVQSHDVFNLLGLGVFGLLSGMSCILKLVRYTQTSVLCLSLTHTRARAHTQLLGVVLRGMNVNACVCLYVTN